MRASEKYPISRAAFKIFSAVSRLTPRLLCRALETVAWENPVSSLSVLMLIFTLFMLLFNSCAWQNPYSNFYIKFYTSIILYFRGICQDFGNKDSVFIGYINIEATGDSPASHETQREPEISSPAQSSSILSSNTGILNLCAVSDYFFSVSVRKREITPHLANSHSFGPILADDFFLGQIHSPRPFLGFSDNVSASRNPF